MAEAEASICLCLSVHDDAEALGRCLASARELADGWCVVDRGAPAGTRELVESALAGRPGAWHTGPASDPPTERSELAALAAGQADYLLLIDADMTVEASGPLGPLGADAYLLSVGDGPHRRDVRHLIRSDLGGRYVGVTHAYLESTGGPESVAALATLRLDRHADPGQSDAELTADLERLSVELGSIPADPAAQFSLAQTCADLGARRQSEAMLANARVHYERRAQMGGWAEEVHWSQLQAGQLAERLGDWPGALDAYLRAWESRPARLEAIHRLSVGLRQRNLYQAAHRFARIAAHLEPLAVPEDVLGLAPWVYAWGMLFEYSITSDRVGEYENAIRACRALLGLSMLTPEARDQTAETLAHAEREGARVRSGSRPDRRTHRIGHVGSPTRGFNSDGRGGRPGLDTTTMARAAAALGVETDALRTLTSSAEPVAVAVASLDQAVRLRPGRVDLETLVAAVTDPVALSHPDLAEADLILTVGDRAGIPALLLARLFPGAEVVVLEPDPSAAALAAGNLAGLGARARVVDLDGLSAALAGRSVDLLRLDGGIELLARLTTDQLVGVRRVCAAPGPDAEIASLLDALNRLDLRAEALADGRVQADRSVAEPA